MDTFLLFVLVGMVIMLIITYKVLEHKLNNDVQKTKEMLCEREQKLTEWVEGLVKKQIDGTAHILARLSELETRLKMLEESVGRLKDRMVQELKLEDDYVYMPEEKRSKPSMRNPLRTYEQYDRFKDIKSGLYVSVKPKQKQSEKGDE